jgi:hypothetical protein
MKLYDMTIRKRSRRRRGPNKPAEERKDHLIQARVPGDLEAVLKQDAKRKRLSVSHLIRNVLEDTYKLVDGVIDEVDHLVQDSVELTGRVKRDAKQIARSAAGLRSSVSSDAERREAAVVSKPRAREAARAFEARTADIYAWNAVVLNRAASCERCGRALERGDTGHLGLSQHPTAAPRWLCADCLATL